MKNKKNLQIIDNTNNNIIKNIKIKINIIINKNNNNRR